MTEFPKISFEKAYMQKGRIGLFQILFPGKGFTTFSVFDFGERIKPVPALIKNGILEWAFEEEEFYSLAKKYAEKLQKKEAFKERFGKWMEICNKIQAFSWQVYKRNLATLPEQALSKLLAEISDLISQFWNYSLFIDVFDTGYDIEDIERINKRFGFDKKEVQLLVTPTKKSYVQENKQLLYGLAENFSEEKKQEFLQKFFWIKTDYAETGRYDEKDLLQELTELKKTDWKKEKQELLNSFEETERQQLQILKAKNLEENPFWFYNELTFWRDERKRYNYMSLFGATQIALELLKRKKMEKYLNAITNEELFKLPEKKEIERRLNGLLCFIFPEKSIVYSEEDAEKKFSEMVGLQEAKGDLRGMSASIGTATGKAKIILSPKDFHKMQQGDVLVTHMTRPEFVPIMKKAAAIVTDEGGITCHAAIISRELGIPCVVGTKIATKTLKDNDTIEVRANHGLVRKLG